MKSENYRENILLNWHKKNVKKDLFYIKSFGIHFNESTDSQGCYFLNIWGQVLDGNNNQLNLSESNELPKTNSETLLVLWI